MSDLTYVCDGTSRTLRGVAVSVDKSGKFWIWSERLQHNIAIKARSREEALIQAISSLLFTLELREQEISKLSRIAALAQAFADQLKPDCDSEEN